MGWSFYSWYEELVVMDASAVDNLGVYGRHGWDVPISAFNEEMMLVRQTYSSTSNLKLESLTDLLNR